MQVSFQNPQIETVKRTFLNDLLKTLENFAFNKKIMPRLARLRNKVIFDYNLVNLLFEIGKNFAIGSPKAMAVPVWLTPELQDHFINEHNKGHNLYPCTKCSIIDVDQRIREMITHTARVSIRAALDTIPDRVIDPCLIDPHQEKSLAGTKTYIENKCTLFRHFPKPVSSDIAAVTYFVMQLSVSILSSDEQQFALIQKNLINIFLEQNKK